MALDGLALWLLVVSVGIQLGAGVYEARVLVPLWASAPPQSIITYQTQPLAPDGGRRFWIFWTPMVGAISLVNLFFAWSSPEPQRSWWLWGAGASLAVVIVTFAYFVPLFIRVFPRAGQLPPSEVQSRVWWWVRLNWVRAVFIAIIWLVVLKAFSYGA